MKPTGSSNDSLQLNPFSNGNFSNGKNLLTEVSDEHVCRNSTLESNCNFNVFEYFSMNLAPGLILIAVVLQKIKKESPKQ